MLKLENTLSCVFIHKFCHEKIVIEMIDRDNVIFLSLHISHSYEILKLQAGLCSGLEKSPFGAKSDFEIRAFKGFLYMYKKISPKKGLEVFTPKNLKWKKYIRQSENANGTPLEPLWGSK